MLKKIVVIAILAAAPLFASASSLPTYPFVHANGVGTVRVMPDVGEVDFEITAHDADPEVARQLVETRIAEIKALAESLGLPPEALEIRDVRKDMRKEQGGTPGVVLYDLKCGVHIKVTDLSKWTELLSPLINMPNLDGFMTEFSATDREKIEMELLGEAVKVARRKAEGMAAGFGKKLGAVTAVSAGQLANLTRSMGLAPLDRFYTNSSSRAQTDRRNLLSIGTLRMAQPVDVIFKIGK